MKEAWKVENVQGKESEKEKVKKEKGTCGGAEMQNAEIWVKRLSKREQNGLSRGIKV
jgi:hypothetical protein